MNFTAEESIQCTYGGGCLRYLSNPQMKLQQKKKKRSIVSYSLDDKAGEQTTLFFKYQKSTDNWKKQMDRQQIKVQKIER